MIAVVSLRSEKSVTQSRSNPLLSIVLYAPSLLTLAFQQSQYWPIWLGNRFCTSKSHTLHKEPIVFEFSFHEFWHFNRSLPCSAASAIVLCVKLVSQKFKWEEISGWRTCRIFIKLLHIISNTRSIENWRNRNWKTNAAIIVCVSCACHVTETNLAKNSQKQLQNQIKRKSQPLAYTLSVRQTRRHTHTHTFMHEKSQTHDTNIWIGIAWIWINKGHNTENDIITYFIRYYNLYAINLDIFIETLVPYENIVHAK